MKIVNPLQYPLAVLAGAIVLVVGVRVAKLPAAIVLPLALASTVGLGYLRQSQELTRLHLDNPELERQVRSVQQQASALAEKTASFRVEATRLLTAADQMELLVAVQEACDRAVELPGKIDQMVRRLQGSSSLLSTAELQQQLAQVETRRRASQGVAREQLNTLAERLQRNLELVHQGRDARQAQVANLETLVTDTAGVLQALQNKLRLTNLTDTAQTLELRSLSDELISMQETVNLFVSH